MKTDIEIAQSAKMLPITEVAKEAGIDAKYLEQYGNYKAKVNYTLLSETEKKEGKLILVTCFQHSINKLRLSNNCSYKCLLK